jgi:hypothetical protein
MGINSEEQEAPKDMGSSLSIPVDHPSNYQEKSTKLAELVDPPRFVVPETRKKSVWLCDTL